MNYVVTIPAINSIFLVGDLRGETKSRLEGGPDWEIEEGGWVEVAANFGEWPDGTEAPRMMVCRSSTDPKSYKVFNRSEDVPPNQYQPTGLNWGGVYTRNRWERFAQDGLAALLKFHQMPDDDPPGAMDRAIRSLRGA